MSFDHLSVVGLVYPRRSWVAVLVVHEKRKNVAVFLPVDETVIDRGTSDEQLDFIQGPLKLEALNSLRQLLARHGDLDADDLDLTDPDLWELGLIKITPSFAVPAGEREPERCEEYRLIRKVRA